MPKFGKLGVMLAAYQELHEAGIDELVDRYGHIYEHFDHNLIVQQNDQESRLRAEAIQRRHNLLLAPISWPSDD